MEVKRSTAMSSSVVAPVTDPATRIFPFEAMAMEIPLLVSDLPALVEIVDDPREPRGYAYRAEDPKDLARVAIDCLADTEGRATRVRNAAGWVRRERTWAANGRNFVNAYEQAERRWQAVRL